MRSNNKEQPKISLFNESGDISPILRNLNIRQTLIHKSKQLMDARPLPVTAPPLDLLIQRLAFIYRFHAFIVGLNILTEVSAEKEELVRMRTLLVHCIPSLLDNNSLIIDTQAFLAAANFQQLLIKNLDDNLTATKLQFNPANIVACLQTLPLFRVIKQQEIVSGLIVMDKETLNNWLQNSAIKLLNTFNDAASNLKRRSEFDQRQDCYDAIKGFIIMMGDYCASDFEKPARHYNAITRFTIACRDQRQFFAHHALTQKFNGDINGLIKLGHKVTTDLVPLKSLKHYLKPPCLQKARITPDIRTSDPKPHTVP